MHGAVFGRTARSLAAITALVALTSCSGPPARFTISGHVTYTDGAPAGGCTVVPASPGVGIPEIAILTALDGSFTWNSLPAGTYSVDVECWDPPGGRGHVSDVELDQDRALTITVR